MVIVGALVAPRPTRRQPWFPRTPSTKTTPHARYPVGPAEEGKLEGSRGPAVLLLAAAWEPMLLGIALGWQAELALTSSGEGSPSKFPPRPEGHDGPTLGCHSNVPVAIGMLESRGGRLPSE